MPRLSIIVPIYNVERYLSKCIDSILRQTFADFELILVDDGSPDKCGEIIDKYAMSDRRIITIHQENKGISAARNAGLRIATGEYVGFTDPDDWIEDNMYEVLIKLMEENHADLGCCSFIREMTDGKETGNSGENIPSAVSALEFIKHVYDQPRNVMGTVWNKVFLRTKIKQLFDERLIISEDYDFLTQYCMNINSVAYSHAPLYHYCQREDGATNMDTPKIISAMKCRYNIIKMLRKRDVSVAKHVERDTLDFILYYLKLSKDKDYGITCQKLYLKFVRSDWKHIVINGEISWKLKLVYLRYYLLCCKRRR